MTNSPSGANSFALASRFLHAFEHLAKTLATNHLNANFEQLNVTQLRILQLVHKAPGIRANTAIEQLELAPDTAVNLILAMENMGLLTLDRTLSEDAPALQLGRQSQRMAFQIKATQLSILAEMLSKLPESEQMLAVESLEQVVAQQPE